MELPFANPFHENACTLSLKPLRFCCCGGGKNCFGKYPHCFSYLLQVKPFLFPLFWLDLHQEENPISGYRLRTTDFGIGTQVHRTQRRNRMWKHSVECGNTVPKGQMKGILLRNLLVSLSGSSMGTD